MALGVAPRLLVTGMLLRVCGAGLGGSCPFTDPALERLRSHLCFLGALDLIALAVRWHKIVSRVLATISKRHDMVE